MLTSLFSLFYVTGEFHRFLHRGRTVLLGQTLFTSCTLAVLLWELCLIRHKPSYKIQFSLYRPLSFQYTSINRQKAINVSPFRQSNKKTITIFRNHIRNKTKFCYSSRHSLHYEKHVLSPPWLVNFIFSHVTKLRFDWYITVRFFLVFLNLILIVFLNTFLI